ncbi:hypothetical protein [Streptomyces sp. NPDC090025]|uniref:hypothetical protein n=1 Tax=Streptomyces sp. NPDC090025 TaxID=3365922 RepID=UPI003834B280
MATKPPPKPDTDKDKDDKNKPEEDEFKVTEEVLLDFAKKFEELLKDFSENPYMKDLQRWANGTFSDDAGLLKPANPKELASAKLVQDGFRKLCAQLLQSVGLFEAAAKSSFITLSTIKIILQDAADESITTAEMWDILNDIQKGIKPPTAPATNNPAS